MKDLPQDFVLDEPVDSGLPEGFQLDSVESESSAGLPDGFTLDEPKRSALGEVGVNFAGGVARGIMGAAKGAAALGDTVLRKVEGVADTVESILPISEGRVAGHRAVTGGLRKMLDFESGLVDKAAAVVDPKIEEYFGADPARAGGAQGFFTQKVPQALGSFAPAAAVSMMSGGSMAPVMLSGVLQGAQGGKEDAEAKKATQDQEDLSILLNSAMGFSEGFGLGRVAGRAGKMIAGLERSGGGRVVREVLEETIQNPAQQLVQKIVARDVAGYDTSRGRMQGVGEAALVGAVTAGIAGGAVNAAGAAVDAATPKPTDINSVEANLVETWGRSAVRREGDRFIVVNTSDGKVNVVEFRKPEEGFRGEMSDESFYRSVEGSNRRAAESALKDANGDRSAAGRALRAEFEGIGLTSSNVTLPEIRDPQTGERIKADQLIELVSGNATMGTLGHEKLHALLKMAGLEQEVIDTFGSDEKIAAAFEYGIDHPVLNKFRTWALKMVNMFKPAASRASTPWEVANDLYQRGLEARTAPGEAFPRAATRTPEQMAELEARAKRAAERFDARTQQPPEASGIILPGAQPRPDAEIIVSPTQADRTQLQKLPPSMVAAPGARAIPAGDVLAVPEGNLAQVAAIGAQGRGIPVASPEAAQRADAAQVAFEQRAGQRAPYQGPAPVLEAGTEPTAPAAREEGPMESGLTRRLVNPQFVNEQGIEVPSPRPVAAVQPPGLARIQGQEVPNAQQEEVQGRPEGQVAQEQPVPAREPPDAETLKRWNDILNDEIGEFNAQARKLLKKDRTPKKSTTPEDIAWLNKRGTELQREREELDALMQSQPPDPAEVPDVGTAPESKVQTLETPAQKKMAQARKTAAKPKGDVVAIDEDKAIKAAAYHTWMDNNSRVPLLGVYLDAESQVAVATDGRRLIAIPTKVIGESRIVSPRNYKRDPKHSASKDYPKGSTIDAQFPNWKQVVPKDTKEYGVVDVDASIAPLEAEIAENNAKIKAKERERNAGPWVRVPFAKESAAYRADHLLDAMNGLERSGATKITLESSGDFTGPAVFRGNNGAFAVIMPGRIWNADQLPHALQLGEGQSTGSLSVRRRNSTLEMHRTNERLIRSPAFNDLSEQVQNDLRAYFKPYTLATWDADARAADPQTRATKKAGLYNLGTIESKDNNAVAIAAQDLMTLSATDPQAAKEEMLRLASSAGVLGQLLRQVSLVYNAYPEGMVLLADRAKTKATGTGLTEPQRIDITQQAERVIREKAKLIKAEDAFVRTPSDATATQVQQATKTFNDAQRQYQRKVAETMPKDWATILKLLMQGNALTPISQMANVVGNLVNNPTRFTAQTIAASTEGLLYQLGVLKERTVAQPATSLGNYVEGFTKAGTEFGNIVKTGQNRQRAIPMGEIQDGFHPFRAWLRLMSSEGTMNEKAKALVEGTFGVQAEVMFRALAVGDAPFYGGAYNQALAELGRVRGLRGDALDMFMKAPPKDAVELANERALEAVYQGDTPYARMFSRLANAGQNSDSATMRTMATLLWKPIMLFSKTPANILYEAQDYLVPPVSLGKMLYHSAKGNQREALMAFGKMMTGIAMYSVAAALVRAGLVQGLMKDDEKQRELAYLTLKPGHINLSGLERMMNGQDPSWRDGDRTASYRNLGLIGMVLRIVAGGHDTMMLEDLKQGKAGWQSNVERGVMDSIIASAPGVLGATFDLAAMKGAYTLMNALAEQKFDKWLPEYLKTVSLIAVPNSMRSFNRAVIDALPETDTDPTDYTGRAKAASTARLVVNDLKTRLWMAEQLPVKRDLMGRPIAATPTGANPWVHNLVDVTKSQRITDDKYAGVISDVFTATGDREVIPSRVTRDLRFNDGGPMVRLSDTQLNRYEELTGWFRMKAVDRYADDPRWAQVPDYIKSEVLVELWRVSREAAKWQLYREMKSGLK